MFDEKTECPSGPSYWDMMRQLNALIKKKWQMGQKIFFFWVDEHNKKNISVHFVSHTYYTHIRAALFSSRVSVSCSFKFIFAQYFHHFLAPIRSFFLHASFFFALSHAYRYQNENNKKRFIDDNNLSLMSPFSSSTSFLFS